MDLFGHMDFFYLSVFSTMLSKKDQMKNLFHILGIYVPSTLPGEKKIGFLFGEFRSKVKNKNQTCM